jgi:hypothetical protein
MIDHLGMPVRDIARATEFYLKALAPLGIGIMMEVSAEETEAGAAVGFGSEGKPFFWIGQAPTLGGGGMSMSLSPLRAAPRSMRSMPPRSPLAARTTARPAFVRIITPTITGPSCSTPTATTSRPSATPLPSAQIAQR